MKSPNSAFESTVTVVANCCTASLVALHRMLHSSHPYRHCLRIAEVVAGRAVLVMRMLRCCEVEWRGCMCFGAFEVGQVRGDDVDTFGIGTERRSTVWPGSTPE